MYRQKIDLSNNKYKLCLSYCFEMVADFLLSSRSHIDDNRALSRIKHFSPHLISDPMYILKILHTHGKEIKYEF